MAEQIIWKTTYKNGDTCHFGNYATALAAARESGVVEEVRIKHAELAVVEREIATVEQAAELAFGLLWMKEQRGEKDGAAYKALSDALTKPAKKRGIQSAISVGFEADHPVDADYWCGMKSSNEKLT